MGSLSHGFEDEGPRFAAPMGSPPPAYASRTRTSHAPTAGRLPGGEREQAPDPRNVTKAPEGVRRNQLCGDAEGYRAKAIADGIPERPNGLFPPGDGLLRELASAPSCHPFEKHLPGERGPYQLLPQGGWATGDAAARSGMDLRMFCVREVGREGEARDGGVDDGRGARGPSGRGSSPPSAEAATTSAETGDAVAPPTGGSTWSLVAAVRFGAGACIGDGFHLSVHGGAVETCLDEATAELGKLAWVPMLTTVEATFRLRAPVLPHLTYRVRCEIARRRGIRCWITGTLDDPVSGKVHATCEAVLADITAWI